MQHFFSESGGHDDYPIASIAGSLHELLLRIEDPVARERIVRTIQGQLEILEKTIKHPYAEEVKKLVWDTSRYVEDAGFRGIIASTRISVLILADIVRKEVREIIRERISILPVWELHWEAIQEAA